MPRVSIIMATYNCECTLDKCIQSIIQQTYKDWEFIICDDCSTDNTYKVLMNYQKQYPAKIIVLKNSKNSKLAFSLNKCLKQAQGEYIARMDGDDESMPTRLQKQVEFLDNNPQISVVGTAMIPFDSTGTRPIRYAKREPLPLDLVKGPTFFHATIMMRKEAYDLVEGYTVSKRTMRAQDYDMWFRFFEHQLKGINLQEGLYKVLEDDDAIKRRTLRSRIYEVQTRFLGYKRLGFPWYVYIYALKPIFSALTPVYIIQKFHNYTAKKSEPTNKKVR